MKIRFGLIIAILVALFCGIVAARMAAQNDPLDPTKVAADTNKLAFENAFVRVVEIHIKPGQVENRHHHPHGVSIYYTDWDARVTVDGGKAETSSRKAGTFNWSEAVTHKVENIGKTEGHLLRIELKM